MKNATLSLPLLLAACGPGLPGGTGIETMPPPQDRPCVFEGETIEHGEHVTTADGCVEYQCDNASFLMVGGDSTTVAGDLMLDSQEAVDAQQCLVEVGGNLTISNTAADFATLVYLQAIGGDLTIVNCDAQTLIGLEGIVEVGGDIRIADNAALTQLAFRPNMSAYGNVAIQNNDVLSSLAGAGFLGNCGNCLGVPDDGSAATGAPSSDGGADQEPVGPNGVFYGEILIADNDVLQDISALSNLVYAWDSLRIRNNVTLAGLPYMALLEVQGDLEFSNNTALDAEAVTALVANVDVWGDTINCGNGSGPACE
jgi:hypothetical protein